MRTLFLFALPAILCLACGPLPPRDANIKKAYRVSVDTDQIVEVALAEMEAAQRDNFLHKEDPDLEITIRFADIQSLGLKSITPGTIGLAQTNGDECTITLDTDIDPANGPELMGEYLDAQLAHVVRHEVGHCFGLDHVEEDETDVMHPYAMRSQWLEENIARFNAVLKAWRTQ